MGSEKGARMVTTSGPASHSPSDVARTVALTTVLDRLKQRPPLTAGQSEALDRLGAIHADMKEGPQKAAAAKVAFLRNKMMAVQLAAGAASATGDLKFARSAIHDMRALVKDLARALKDAGMTQDPAAADPAAPAPPSQPAPAEASQTLDAARELVKELKKVVGKLRIALVAAQIRGADPEAVKEAEKNLRDGEKELQSLSSSLSAKSSSGHAIDLRA